MEISEIKYSYLKEANYAYRWDSVYYQKHYLSFERHSKNWISLSDICLIKSGSTPPDRDENLKSGIVLFKTNDVRNNIMLDKGDDFFYIDETINRRMKSTQIFHQDVLINIVGATTDVIGRVSYIPEKFPLSNITQAMAFLRLGVSNIKPEYLFAFLSSSYGNIQVSHLARPTGQYNLNLTEVGMLKIPLLPDSFQSRIADMVKSAHSKLEESKMLYRQAEEILEKELGLKNWQPENKNVSVKSFSDFKSSGRLDAEYYQPKYDELFAILSKFDCDRLFQIVSIKKSIEPGSDAYQKEGIPFIRVSDVSKYGISSPDLYLSPNDFDVESLKPRKNTILFSKDGSIGIAYKVNDDINCITSGALLHLNIFNEEYLPDYLTLVLNSNIVKMQAERDSNGAVIQHWKPDEINQVIIPKLSIDIQQTIASKIQESFALKAESKQLLEDAKRMVEEEIEKGG